MNKFNCDCECHEPKHIEPTLIILKHSKRQGAAPTPSQLEIGEIALSLFPGQEALWAKNSKGEIVDMRKPSPTGLWGSAFEEFATRDDFEIAKEEGLISDSKIYFITREKQIWVKGEFYASDYDPKELDRIVSSRILIFAQEVGELNPETSTSEDISSAFGGAEKFRETAINVSTGKLIAGIRNGLGIVPVSVKVAMKGGDDVTLELGWLGLKNYKYLKINLRYDIFGIEGEELNFLDTLKSVSTLQEKVNEIEGGLCWNEVE